MIFGKVKETSIYFTYSQEEENHPLSWFDASNKKGESCMDGAKADAFFNKASRVTFEVLDEAAYNTALARAMGGLLEDGADADPITPSAAVAREKPFMTGKDNIAPQTRNFAGGSDNDLPPRDDNSAKFGIESLSAEFKELREGAAAYYAGNISDNEIDTAAIFSKKIAKIGRSVKKLQDAATDPIKNELERVNAIYDPLRNECRDWMQTIKKNMEAAVKAQKQREMERIAAEKEALRQEQERIAAKAQHFKEDTADINSALQLSQEIAAVDKKEKYLKQSEQNAGAAGITGAKVSLRKYPDAVITDYVAFMKYVEHNDPSEFSLLEEAMRKCALRLFKNGDNPDGATKTFIEKLV